MEVLWPVEHVSHARDLGSTRVKRASSFKKSQTAVSTTKRYFTLSVVCLIVESTNSYWYKKFRAKIIGRRICNSILLNNNTLVIINNTKEMNCCYFPIEKRRGNIIYCNKTLKIVVFDVTFCFSDNFDVTSV